MGLADFPTELQSMILGELLHADGQESELEDRGVTLASDHNFFLNGVGENATIRRRRHQRPGDHLRSARLVCRQWNELAVKHLFREVSLLHCRHVIRTQMETEQFLQRREDPGGRSGGRRYNFKMWNAMASSETVRKAARGVNIYSGPHHYRIDREVAGNEYDSEMAFRHRETWRSWELGSWKEFEDAISRISDLPGLKEVSVWFSKFVFCKGTMAQLEIEDGQMDIWDHWPDCELISTRFYTLREVFKAMALHKARNSNPIKSLSIRNLANAPFPELLSPGSPLLTIAKDITKLRLDMTHEPISTFPSGNTAPEWTRGINETERRDFEPFLQKRFLSHFVDSLTWLHLSFRHAWGVAPGTFDGRGLAFPNLRTLSLHNFQIAHHDHFDWVLNQTSLENLYLDHCAIVVLIHLADDQVKRWGVNTEDWDKYPAGAWGFGTGRVYRFLGTWETLFDHMITYLPCLVDFRMAYTDWRSAPRDCFELPDPGCPLSPMRYDILSLVMGERAWNETRNRRDDNGDIMMGDNNKGPHTRTQDDWYPPMPKPNRARETKLGDASSWNHLHQVIQERRRRREAFL
ncbi:hypothetical protein QBC43DRAFT_325042 [Cladorrhinum sp. PSN259]|nr:hypothetical protein QBC43DRAFT_325042 [Cladorrhinum sp. PSN259]